MPYDQRRYARHAAKCKLATASWQWLANPTNSDCSRNATCTHARARAAFWRLVRHVPRGRARTIELAMSAAGRIVNLGRRRHRRGRIDKSPPFWDAQNGESDKCCDYRCPCPPRRKSQWGAAAPDVRERNVKVTRLPPRSSSSSSLLSPSPSDKCAMLVHMYVALIYIHT